MTKKQLALLAMVPEVTAAVEAFNKEQGKLYAALQKNRAPEAGPPPPPARFPSDVVNLGQPTNWKAQRVEMAEVDDEPPMSAVKRERLEFLARTKGVDPKRSTLLEQFSKPTNGEAASEVVRQEQITTMSEATDG